VLVNSLLAELAGRSTVPIGNNVSLSDFGMIVRALGTYLTQTRRLPTLDVIAPYRSTWLDACVLWCPG
jgi:hypothetical protein